MNPVTNMPECRWKWLRITTGKTWGRWRTKNGVHIRHCPPTVIAELNNPVLRYRRLVEAYEKDSGDRKRSNHLMQTQKKPHSWAVWRQNGFWELSRSAWCLLSSSSRGLFLVLLSWPDFNYCLSSSWLCCHSSTTRFSFSRSNSPKQFQEPKLKLRAFFFFFLSSM